MSLSNTDKIDLLKKHQDSLVSLNALFRFFENFELADIDYLKDQSPNFKYTWEAYVLPNSPGTVSYLTCFEFLLGKMSADTQALVMDYALNRYRENERRNLQMCKKILTMRDEQAEES